MTEKMKPAAELDIVELLSERADLRAQLDAPGFFHQFGEDAENVRQAVIWRIQELESALATRRADG